METIVTSKGQVVIPSKVRRKLGVKEGTYLHIDVDEITKVCSFPARQIQRQGVDESLDG
jgi:AbrB family looped-hinge helix DNA binding protein